MKTVKSSELVSFRMVAGNEKKFDKVIHNGEVKQWVGFGWVSEGVADDEDRKKYPTVINEE